MPGRSTSPASRHRGGLNCGEREQGEALILVSTPKNASLRRLERRYAEANLCAQGERFRSRTDTGRTAQNCARYICPSQAEFGLGQTPSDAVLPQTRLYLNQVTSLAPLPRSSQHGRPQPSGLSTFCTSPLCPPRICLHKRSRAIPFGQCCVQPVPAGVCPCNGRRV